MSAAHWVTVGERLRYTDRPDGEKAVGIDRTPNRTAWLRGGACGVVVKPPTPDAPAYPCPNHHLGSDDCICGEDGDGMLSASPGLAVVEWEMDDGGAPIRRGIRLRGEGTTWQRAITTDEIKQAAGRLAPGEITHLTIMYACSFLPTAIFNPESPLQPLIGPKGLLNEFGKAVGSWLVLTGDDFTEFAVAKANAHLRGLGIDSTEAAPS